MKNEIESRRPLMDLLIGVTIGMTLSALVVLAITIVIYLANNKIID